MTLLTVVSAKGSPGATTFAMRFAEALPSRLAAPGRSVCLVDADPDGGDIALILGLDPIPGIGTLALSGRHGFDENELLEHCQHSAHLPEVAVVPGTSGRSRRSPEWVAEPLAQAAASATFPVVVDAGRIGTALGSASPAFPLLEKADQLIVVCRSDTASIVHCRSALLRLEAGRSERADPHRPLIVVIDSTGESPAELADVLGHPLAGVLPFDRSSTWPARGRTPVGHVASRGIGPASRRSREAIAGIVSVVLGKTEPVRPSKAVHEAAPASVALGALRAARSPATRS